MFEAGKQVVCIKMPPEGNWAGPLNDVRDGPRVGQVLTVSKLKLAFGDHLYLSFAPLYGTILYQSEYFRPCRDTSQTVGELKRLLEPSKQKV